MASRRLRLAENETACRMAELILEGIDKFRDVMTPEGKGVLFAKFCELLTGRDSKRPLQCMNERWYNAAEIGATFGATAQLINKIADEYGLKAPRGNGNQYGAWVRASAPGVPGVPMIWMYCEAGREWFVRYFTA